MSARFYFGALSPYSWFAAERLADLLPAARWRPVFAGGLFRSVGRVSWGLTSEREQRMADCRRRAAEHGLGAIRWPDGWPQSDLLPARAMVVADRAGRLAPFAVAAMRACFQQGRDITLPEVLASLADSTGLDADQFLEQTQEPAIKEALRMINDEAIAAGIIGVPSVVVGAEVFWGDDRLVDAARASRGTDVSGE